MNGLRASGRTVLTVVTKSKQANCIVSMLSTKNGSTASVDTAKTIVSMKLQLPKIVTKIFVNSTSFV